MRFPASDIRFVGQVDQWRDSDHFDSAQGRRDAGSAAGTPWQNCQNEKNSCYPTKKCHEIAVQARTPNVKQARFALTMPTHGETILPLRALQAANRTQLPDRKFVLAGEGSRPENPPQHKAGDAE